MLVLFGAAGCARPWHLNVRLPPGTVVPERPAILLFVDGLDRYVYEDMLARGELPAIERYIVRRGTMVEQAFSCLPSITYANTVSFLTGLYPGHHGIVGNEWFERRTLTFRTYNTIGDYRRVNDDFSARTIYEVLPDRLTVNLQSATRRGVKITMDNWAESGVCWFFGWFKWADGLIARNFERFDEIARRHGRWPDFVHAYFPGLDAEGHRSGSDSAAYREGVRNIDQQIHKICDALGRLGLLDRTYLILAVDHGHAPAPRSHYLDVAAWLRKHRGWRVYDAPPDGAGAVRGRGFERYAVVAVNGGSRRYELHLRGAEGWSMRPGFDRCREVLAGGERPLALERPVLVGACRRGADEVWVYGRSGEAVVCRRVHDRREEYRYDLKVGDPLGYTSEPGLSEFVAAGWHSSREWLAATAGARCPDTVAQIVSYFDSPRAADVVVFADEGWDFSRNASGGHGSILRHDMWVPMAFVGPGIAAGGRLGIARNADIAPTIVELIAGPDRLAELGTIDGVSLVPQLLGAAPGGAAIARVP